jgi:hypothetical protein
MAAQVNTPTSELGLIQNEEDWLPIERVAKVHALVAHVTGTTRRTKNPDMLGSYSRYLNL